MNYTIWDAFINGNCLVYKRACTWSRSRIFAKIQLNSSRIQIEMLEASLNLVETIYRQTTIHYTCKNCQYPCIHIHIYMKINWYWCIWQHTMGTHTGHHLASCCHGSHSSRHSYYTRIVVNPNTGSKYMTWENRFLSGCRIVTSTGRCGVSRNLVSRRPSRVHVQALFEQFTERSIKSIIYAQGFCRDLGGSEVRCWLLWWWSSIISIIL